MTIAEWTLSGKTGESSLSMARAASGVRDSRVSHPHDPDDLIRCLDFCDDTGTSPEVMRGKSEEWDRLINIWGDLRESLASEIRRSPDVTGRANSWDACRNHELSAPKTYELMQVTK